MSLTLGAMAGAAVDPDAQATITDFLDFTEYFPSDLIRSLTLIRGLDTTYQSNAFAIHDLTKVYSTLPTINPSNRPDPSNLRQQISYHLDRAIDARENAFAEATRAYESASRNANRLQSILSKLRALPTPPSRDPTPQPISSPEAKRSRSGRKIDNAFAPRLTLNPPRYPVAIAGQKRKRQLIIPGEPLPPYDPDSPIASTEQSDTEAPASPTNAAGQGPKSLKLKVSRAERPPGSRAPRRYHSSMPRPDPPPEDAQIGSEHRPWTRITPWERFRIQKSMKKGVEWEPPGTLVRKTLEKDGRGLANFEEAKKKAEEEGTELLDCDAHLRDGATPPPTAPPPVTVPPSQPAPIVPAVPTVPPVPIVPTVPTATREASPVPKPKPSTSESRPATADSAPPSGTIVVEKREKKTPAPKRSRKSATNAVKDPVVDEAAKRTTLELQTAAQGLNNLSRLLNGLYRPPTPVVTPTPPPKKKRKTTSRPTPSIAPEQSSPAPSKEPQSAQSDTNPPSLTPTVSAPASTTSTAKIPLKISLSTQPPQASQATIPSTVASTELSSPTSQKEPSRASSRIASRQPSIIPKVDPSLTPPPPPAAALSRQSSARPPSRRSITTSVEPSVAPVIIPTTRNLRRNSTPASNLRKTPKPTASPKTTEPTAASRRSKRPQGAVAQNKEDGAAIIKTNRRKGNKPGLKLKPTTALEDNSVAAAAAAAAAAAQAYMRTDIDGRVEIIPEDEPRYCLCDDISYGDMIACDHGVAEDGCREWFHMGCVGLLDMPGRTVKWYCPNCRIKLRKGESTNGLVGRTIKA